ncbi:MAG TPA: DUF4423 domain-containing protein [Bacteriovoracaceae bacterium]|nr:DUF4423 domain-containing protein [Bacteriovoracaceae bacterium]
MEAAKTYYLNKLKEHFSLKQRTNPHYSLRAYARDLGLHSSTLCSVFKGNRGLPLKNFKEVALKLNLSPKERTLFLESLYTRIAKNEELKTGEEDERFILDDTYYQVIAEWEHFAVESLLEISDFVATQRSVARRLGITENRAEVVIENLKTCGLVKEGPDGGLIKIHVKIRTTEDVLSPALRASHLETLEMGRQKLDEVDIGLRDYSSVTLTLNIKRVPEVKILIRDFRQKLLAHFAEGLKTDVCQLAIQFYPLTKTQNEPEDKLT